MPSTSCANRACPTSRTGARPRSARICTGTNYVLEAVVAGQIDPATGYVSDLLTITPSPRPGRPGTREPYRRSIHTTGAVLAAERRAPAPHPGDWGWRRRDGQGRHHH